jgi:predicted MPP superfamily phosphohydrolase
MGNWEHWSEAPPSVWRPLLAKYGVRLLVEEHVLFDEFAIFGTDDHLAGQSHPHQWKFSDLPYIALSHSPAFFPKLCRDPIQLVLSGHAHGGQIRLPFLKALWVPKGTEKYVSGWFHSDKQHLFVCRGLGWSVAPLRMLCPPEAAYIDLIPCT